MSPKSAQPGIYLGSGGSRRELKLVRGSGSQGHGQIRCSTAQNDSLATLKLGRGNVTVGKNEGMVLGLESRLPQISADPGQIS